MLPPHFPRLWEGALWILAFKHSFSKREVRGIQIHVASCEKISAQAIALPGNQMGFTTLRPTRTVVTSFTPLRTAASDTFHPPTDNNNNDALLYEHGDWVLCLVSSNDTVSCALSNGQVQVYDQQRLHLVTQFDYSSSGSSTTTTSSSSSNNNNTTRTMVKDLCYGPNGNTVVAVGDQGKLVLLDLRQSQQQQAAALQTSYSSPVTLESISLGFQGTIAAAGSAKGKIHFFDLRMTRSLSSTYGDSHTDALSQVVFASESSPILLSGAEDGLACCFDTRQPTEELALQSVCNVGTPLRRVGFCGANGGGGGGDDTTKNHHQNHGFADDPKTIFCLTGSETASLWDWEKGTCLQQFGGFELRQNLTQSLAAVSSVGGAAMNLDYLIDAHWDTASSELLMATGNSAGEGAVFRLSRQAPDQWQPCHVLHGGHRGVIRAWCPLHYAPSMMLSAGEDARLVEWNRQQDSFLGGESSHQHGASSSMVDAPPMAPRVRPAGTPPDAPPMAPRVRPAGTPPRTQPKRHKLSTSPF